MESDIDKKLKNLSVFLWLGGLLIMAFGYSGFIGASPPFVILTFVTIFLTSCIVARMVYLYYFS